MELFAREHQHEPMLMLKDLIALYTLHYNVDLFHAAMMLRSDVITVREQMERTVNR